MDLSNLGALAGSLARAGLPALGTILGAVLPPPWDIMAGGAFKLVSAAMGVSPDAPDAPAQVQAAVDADPAAAATKLQTIEQAHKDAADAVNRELELRLADVQDARKATGELAQAGSQIAWGAPVVSAVVTLGFVAIVMVMTVHAIPESSVANVLVGTLATAFGSVVNYWLGSSAGSREKDAHLADLARAPTVNAQPGSHVSSGVISGRR